MWRAPVSCLTTHKHILTLNTTSMSKKIFSAQDWENVPFENSVPTSPKLLPAPNSASNNKEEEIERIICEIEQRAVDIAPEYKDWVELGFALIDGFGENGREYYHRISRFHPDYQREETDKQYTRCLQAKGQGITIRSFFHLAGLAGIPLNSVGEQDLAILHNNPFVFSFGWAGRYSAKFSRGTGFIHFTK